MAYIGESDAFRRIPARSGSDLSFKANDLAYREFSTGGATATYANISVGLNDQNWSPMDGPAAPTTSGTGWLFVNNTGAPNQGGDGDFTTTLLGPAGSEATFGNTSGAVRRVHCIATLGLQNGVGVGEEWAFALAVGNGDVGTTNEIPQSQVSLNLPTGRFTVTIQRTFEFPIYDNTLATTVHVLGRRVSVSGPAGAVSVLNAQISFNDF